MCKLKIEEKTFYSNKNNNGVIAPYKIKKINQEEKGIDWATDSKLQQRMKHLDDTMPGEICKINRTNSAENEIIY